MAKPFKKIDGDVLASTNAACSDQGGWTSDHADWLRQPGRAERVRELMDREMGLVTTPKIKLYEKERGTSGYTPPPGWRPKREEVQHDLLREVWPGLEPPPSIEVLIAPYIVAGTPVLPDDEGFFFVAKLSSILRIVKGYEGLPDYQRALKYLFGMLSERQPNSSFKYWSDGDVGLDDERPLEAWWKRRIAYEATIKGDFVAYMGQTGIAYRNWSIRAARADMKQSECRVGMTSLDVAQILLFHEDRLTTNRDLAIDCAGAERNTDIEGGFRSASFFDYYAGNARFVKRPISQRVPDFGSASFTLPEGA